MKPHEYIETFEGIYEQLKGRGFTKREQVDIAIAILQEVGKDNRQENINSNPPKATPKQIELLKKKGYENPEKYTKRQASMIITRLINQGK